MKNNMNEPHITRGKINNKLVLLRNGNPQGNPNNAPRCGAKTRLGLSCKAPAMANGRCRMHGGKSSGPRTPEGLQRSRRANWKHGYYSAEAIARRKYFSNFFRQCRATYKRITEDIQSGKIYECWPGIIGITESEPGSKEKSEGNN